MSWQATRCPERLLALQMLPQRCQVKQMPIELDPGLEIMGPSFGADTCPGQYIFSSAVMWQGAMKVWPCESTLGKFWSTTKGQETPCTYCFNLQLQLKASKNNTEDLYHLICSTRGVYLFYIMYACVWMMSFYAWKAWKRSRLSFSKSHLHFLGTVSFFGLGGLHQAFDGDHLATIAGRQLLGLLAAQHRREAWPPKHHHIWGTTTASFVIQAAVHHGKLWHLGLVQQSLQLLLATPKHSCSWLIMFQKSELFKFC